MAAKRTERWSTADREWLASLPADERDLVLLLAAHLDARPVEEEKPDA